VPRAELVRTPARGRHCRAQAGRARFVRWE
jgi:hypothetical protein